MRKDTKWYKTMLEKYGSDEAIAEVMRERQRKSRETYTGGGGFRYLVENDPEKMKQISKLGGRISRRKK